MISLTTESDCAMPKPERIRSWIPSRVVVNILGNPFPIQLLNRE
jgi:hypothetical protein